MSFLNPILLLALPLIALPVLIHLINNRRYQTVDWGAVQFLVQARRTNKGRARLRQWLIMAARMILIAAIVCMVSRPLTTSWVGSLTGNRADTVIVLLDRSASMQKQDINSGQTKLKAGVAKIVETLDVLAGQQPIVLIESHSNQPIVLPSSASLFDMPQTQAAESQADIVGMLETAVEYLSQRQSGRTDIWICSDAAENDWNVKSSRWTSLTATLQSQDGVAIHVLNYSEPAANNRSVRVDRVQRIATESGTELEFDLSISSSEPETKTVQMVFNINGLRSVEEILLNQGAATLAGHRIRLAEDDRPGWGYVGLPADTNASDNTYYFTFAEPAALNTVIVSDEQNLLRTFRLAASTSTSLDRECDSIQLSSEQTSQIDWQTTSLLIWQTPLPTGAMAEQVEKFIAQGRAVLFLPPQIPNDTTFLGFRWNKWQQQSAEDQTIGYWKTDDDLLTDSRVGSPLPVDQLAIRRCCQLSGKGTLLASLNEETQLLTRAATDAGAAYFLSTLPTPTHSNLDENAVVLFIATHRALEQSAESSESAKHVVAGTAAALQARGSDSVHSESKNIITTRERPFFAGVYRDNNQLLAVNRPIEEDISQPLPTNQVDQLFAGVNHQVINDRIESSQKLASEIWRWFVLLMGAALAIETALSVPQKQNRTKVSILNDRTARATA